MGSSERVLWSVLAWLLTAGYVLYNNKGRLTDARSNVIVCCSQVSITGTVVAHVAHVLIPPPTRYPHIHDYVFAAYSCGHFLLALGYCTYWQWTATATDESDSSTTKAKTE